MGLACIASMRGSSIMRGTRDSLPRLCQPYRAQTKGKVERFIGYLKRSFWVAFVASMRQSGLKPDKHATNEVPAERLVIEQAALQALPAPYRGRSARSLIAPMRKTIIGYQHPLAVYEELRYGRRAMNNLQHERITVLAQDLRLTALPDLYQDGIAQSAANKKDVSYADFLEDVLKAERDARHCPVPRNTDADGGFPALKTLEAYDFTFARSQIQELASLGFVERAENIVLLGPSGTGKTQPRDRVRADCGAEGLEGTLHDGCRPRYRDGGGLSTRPDERGDASRDRRTEAADHR